MQARWKLVEVLSNLQSIPKLVNCPFSSIEIWLVDDIVSNISSCSGPESSSGSILVRSNDALINPANSSLCGTKFPYFPVGGPVPMKIGENFESESNQWGGMEAGTKMHYPIQAVDGRVHMEGGRGLRELLKASFPGGIPVGESCIAVATGQLRTLHQYHFIVHTAIPLVNSPSPARQEHQVAEKDELLFQCYLSAFRAVLSEPSIRYVASPLLGAGTAGFGTQRASCILSRALQVPQHKLLNQKELKCGDRWDSSREVFSRHDHDGRTLRMVAQSHTDVELLLKHLLQFAHC